MPFVDEIISLRHRTPVLRATLLGILLPFVLAACGGTPGTDPPGAKHPPALEVELAAPPPHDPLDHAEGYVWTRGDTVVLRHHASLDGRDDVSGWAVQDGHLIHMVETVTSGPSIDDETAESVFFRLDVTDPDAEWAYFATESLPYDPLRFTASLHATGDGLVAVTRYGFLTSRDLGATWTPEPLTPDGLGGALSDLNGVLVTEAGYPIVLKQANTVAAYDGGATYEHVGAGLHARNANWSDVEQLPGGVLILPNHAERSDDGDRTWTPYLARGDLDGYGAYLRGDDVYLWERTVKARALVHRPDGRIEMLLAKAPDEAGGNRLTRRGAGAGSPIRQCGVGWPPRGCHPPGDAPIPLRYAFVRAIHVPPPPRAWAPASNVTGCGTPRSWRAGRRS